MSNKAMTWAIDCKGVPLPTKAILMLLADCHNASTGLCCPKEDWLAEKAGIAPRTVRMHLLSLEELGLIERLYKHGGRGVGRKFDGYILKIGLDRPLETPQNDTQIGQDIATAESCHGRNTPLPRQNPAKPIIKKEPELNRKPYVDLLDGIWEVWSAEGKKRSASREQLIKKLKTKTKGEDLASVLKAFKAYASDQKPEFHAGIQVLLNSGQWKNFLAEPKAEEREPDQIPVEEWRRAQRAYIEFEAWPREKLGPAPHEPGCRAPESTLRIIASRMNAHRYHKDILRNLTLEAAA